MIFQGLGRSSQFGRVAISRPPQAEHRSLRPMSGTGMSAGQRSALSTASCWHVSQVAEIDRTPSSRMLAAGMLAAKKRYE